jgi:hypothetical protein
MYQYNNILLCFISISMSCRETWEKVNLTFHENGTLTYNQRKVYRFDRELSAGSEDDVVVVPNIPMLVSTIEHWRAFAQRSR